MPISRGHDEDEHPLKKEIVETHNLIIKTDNLIKNLGAEVKGIGKRQEGYEKRLWLNSIGAYALFVAILGGMTFFLVESRVKHSESQVQDLSRQIEACKTDKDKLEGERSKRDERSKRAKQLFDWMSNPSTREQALKEFQNLGTEALSAMELDLLRERAESIQSVVAEREFQAGMKEFKARQWEAAAKNFADAARKSPRAKWASEMNFHWGLALWELGRHDESTQRFEQSMTTDAPQDQKAKALFFIARNYEATARMAKAQEYYSQVVSVHPRHPLARIAKSKLRPAPTPRGGTPKPTPRIN
ncbi:MAG: hypothetical protein HYY84_20850 [Deltaproteobacteria bacterium]|nr:hypothetical protein [Deltaproteobacteria bacterium]